MVWREWKTRPFNGTTTREGEKGEAEEVEEEGEEAGKEGAVLLVVLT
jgi:hypothetical protein